MTNEEYQQLIFDITYQTLSEEFGEEYINEKKNLLASLIQKGATEALKAAKKHNQNVDEYRRRAEVINRTTDPKEKKRLERQQQNFSIKKGVDDNSKTCGEHVAHAVKNGVTSVTNTATALYNKAKNAVSKSNNSTPVGLSGLNKQTT